MKVISVNVGLPRDVIWNGATVQTGIFKEPVDGPVEVGKLNLTGDQQADLTVHGGSGKAVYAYPAEHYEYWREQLPGVALPWGSFGENLTTQGLSEETVCIGDRMSVGSAVLLVTQPRMPCYKLGIRFEREDIIKRFLLSGRTGFYFAVAEKGTVASQWPIEIVHRDPQQVSVADVVRLYLGKANDAELLQRATAVSSLPQNWRAHLLQRARQDGSI